MSDYSLGAGFERFRVAMDTEAEATVKINQTDGQDAPEEVTPPAPESVEDAEVAAAEDEQQTEDLESASDEVNQTMRYLSKLTNQHNTVTRLLGHFKSGNVDDSTMQYIDINYGLITKIRGSVEKFDVSNPKHMTMAVKALGEGQASLWDRIKAVAASLMQKVRELWAKFKNWIVKKIADMQSAAKKFQQMVEFLKLGKIEYESDDQVPDADTAIAACKAMGEADFSGLTRELTSGKDVNLDTFKSYISRNQDLDLSTTVTLKSSKWTQPRMVLQFAQASKGIVDAERDTSQLEQALEKKIKELSTANTSDDGAARSAMNQLQQVQQLFSVLQNTRFKPAMRVVAMGSSILNQAMRYAQKVAAEKKQKGGAGAPTATPAALPA